MSERRAGDDAVKEKWAERDRKREFHEKVMADQAAAERERLAGVVEDALAEWDCSDVVPWDEVARKAIDALVKDGVIFAYIGPENTDPADDD